MQNLKRNGITSIFVVGIVFLVSGFVRQGFTFSFESGLFTLGVIFTISGLVASVFRRKA